ncbi:unnamed protein product [Adineta ricciae]|uniref:Transmembrane protein n=1 Tax=Adineta ricciae TaxID=249248 RepID=A0A814UV50_ADIRI|nr:unnamed protein product [Adineta ricciae]CAF1180525.1 unnamed protein product [Adineta ricciae]
MVSIRLRTNQQSTNSLFYFLHILFLLHIYTAFLTIVNSLNNNDNEAIIQLSTDSIHVVKSSDPRFSNIEENSDDDEEKELLIALLTSFDEDYKQSKEILDEKSIEPKNSNDISNLNNCTSSSPITASATASSSSISIRFVPPLLDFGAQAMAMPRMQTVIIINDDSQPVELQSLSGATVQFYSSFFTQKTLSANGGNTSINVYYLPRTLGLTKSIFTIKTNRGTVHYYVNGIGTLSPFHIRPLIGANIPLNSTFEYTVHFYNPYNHSIDINEIFTSDENLFIELLSYKQQRNKIVKSFEHQQQWHMKPYEVKPIIKINYYAYKLERLHGFYCIKTNSNDTIVVPVEINVSDEQSLYSNVDILEFSPENFIRSTARPIRIPIYVINNGKTPVTITDVRVGTVNINHLTVHYEKLQVPAGLHQLTKIADLIIQPQLIPDGIKRVRGSVQVYTLPALTVDEPTLQIPFRTTVLHGSLDYDRTASYFYIPSSSIDSSNDNKEECRAIKLLNRFNSSVVIYSVTTDKTELLSQYIRLNILSPFIYASPGQTVFPVCISVIKSSVLRAPFNNLEASLTLHTNLSYFHLPLHLYNGLLGHQVVADSNNGGIRRNDTNPSEYFIASIPVNASRTVKFVLQNANPVEISIETISHTLPKSTLQLAQMLSINGSETNAVFKSVYRNGQIIEIVIPARHQAIFSLTINGMSNPSLHKEMITFKTRYETLIMRMKYRTISGSIILQNEKPLYIDVFPNRVGSTNITLYNGFDQPTDVTRMEFPTYGNCFSFIWNTTSPNKLIIESKKNHQIGKLMFDMLPLCNSIQVPSESTCYCGLNNHPEFKKRWDQHVSALDTQELDDVLVAKFRNLWKEWTSLVRKQRIQTNVWLITDQAEVSWPVKIGFVWPSVLEFMTSAVSRAPVVIDYHLTLLNTTKTHNIVITNPSSGPLQYSVELISSYDNKKTRNKRISAPNQQVFDISTTPKRVQLSDEIYRFTLAPNEQMTFTASYRPKHSMKHEIYFVVRNNLTILESILLRGEGGSGSLTVGNRNAGSSDIPLVLEMNEKQYKLCSNYPSTETSRGNPILVKIVTLRNTGNIRAIIHDISFGHSKCSGQGFSVISCSEIEIEPDERYELEIRFQPDYTLTEIAETLTLNTNIGVMTFPLIVRIPQRVLATCYRTIPRPVWETQFYRLCLASTLFMLVYIVAVAVYEAHRLYNDYLARVELRCRMSSTNERLFDLNELTEAVNGEQRIRERIESRTGMQTANTKKDASKDENKARENDTKPKRSNGSTNGSKENSETSSKPSRTSDVSNTGVRSVATSPKAMAHKHKRVTTENGLAAKSSKQQIETIIRSQPLKASKSPNTEQSTASTPCSTTPPSTSLTDEENEPFVPARPKRVTSKVKESTSNFTPVKSTPAVNGTVSSQTTPPPTQPLPSLPTGVSKPTTRLELSDQRHHQQEISRSTDSINDQQWYMVGSNRNIRKGATAATHRRETPDESVTGKTNKTISNNSENPMVSAMSSSRAHASVYNQVTQSRRRRGRRAARPSSPTHIPFLSKRRDFPSNTPISPHNRELAFRQLTEQLWAAGLPSAATACSMSVRSRCSSAPPSERGGADDEIIKIEWNNSYDVEDENIIDWDDPDKPDEDFGRYVPQVELPVEETSPINEWIPATSSSSSSTTTTTAAAAVAAPVDEIPPLMLLPAVTPQIIPATITQKATIPSSIINEEVEPLPFPQHGPGPIQRPNKLTCIPLPQSISTYPTESLHSPETPDVLDHINRLLDHQNNVATGSISSPTSTVSTTSNVNGPTAPINDLSAGNMSWTAFSPTEWSSKYDSSWPLTNLQNPNVSSRTQAPNPFQFLSPINEGARSPPREDSSVWSTALGTTTPRLLGASTRTQRASTWNELFQSTVPSTTEFVKPNSYPWLKVWPTPDPLSVDGAPSNGHEPEAMNPFWNLNTLSTEATASSTTPTQQLPVTTWWSNASSDENNNKSQNNHSNDDPANNRDQSRWDFAR